MGGVALPPKSVAPGSSMKLSVMSASQHLASSTKKVSVRISECPAASMALQPSRALSGNSIYPSHKLSPSDAPRITVVSPTPPSSKAPHQLSSRSSAGPSSSKAPSQPSFPRQSSVPSSSRASSRTRPGKIEKAGGKKRALTIPEEEW